MKRTSFALSLALLFCIAGNTVAQETATLPAAKEVTAKDVIAKYIKATGGEQAYEALKSMQATGKLSIPEQGIGGTIEVYMSGGKVMTMAKIANLGTEKAGGDGETYWSESAFTGVRILDGVEKSQMVQEADLQAELHPDKYFKAMTVKGTAKVGDEECYHVERVRKDGEKQNDFFSVKTGLLLKTVTRVATPLGKLEIANLSSDYRKVGDLMMAFKSEQKLPGNITQVITMDSVKVNEPIDAKLFELPESIKKLKAQGN